MSDALFPLIDRLSAARIIVVGDAMLDIYTTGASTRMMPEAEAAPVVPVDNSTAFFGGAANVAANVAALGGVCDFICLTGQDVGRETMLALADAQAIPRGGFIADDTRPTIAKERIIANGAYVCRVDREKTHDVASAARDNLLSYYKEKLSGAGAVILSDYCKGTLPDDVVRALIDGAQAKNMPVLVDSKRKDLSVFKGAVLAKPNMKELGERVGVFDKNSEAEIEKAARALIAQSGIENLIASRSENGMMLVTKDKAQNYAAAARHVADVSGAGDTVLAVTALALAAGAALEEAVWLANLGAGVAVEKEKTSTITRTELHGAAMRCNKERQSA